MMNPLRQLGTDILYIIKNIDLRVVITGVIMLFAIIGFSFCVYDYLNKKFWTNVDHIIEKRVDEMVDNNPVTIDIDFNSWE